MREKEKMKILWEQTGGGQKLIWGHQDHKHEFLILDIAYPSKGMQNSSKKLFVHKVSERIWENITI